MKYLRIHLIIWCLPCIIYGINEQMKTIIDWEQRRYELAKSAMQGILSDINQSHYACSEENYEKYIPKGIAKFAIVCADALINELK